MTARPVLQGQARFEVRQHPRNKLWEIYDYGDACFPIRTPELGQVTQGWETKELAQGEADRLEELVARATEKPKRRKSTKASSTGETKTVQVEEEPLPEAPAEYEMTEEQKKKHEEEILSGKY